MASSSATSQQPHPRPLGEGSTIHFSRGRSVTLHGELPAEEILRIVDDRDDGRSAGGWLYLNPATSFPEAARQKLEAERDPSAARVDFAECPCVPPLQTRCLDDAVSKASELLEAGASDVRRKNLVLQCSTAQRAGAVAAALLVSSSRSPSRSSSLSLARSAPFKFASNPGVFSWLERWSSEERSERDPSPLFFRQLFEPASSTFTYLLADADAGEAVLIDPVRETAERDFKLIEELGFDLIFGINSHVHADHVTGTRKLRELFAGKARNEGSDGAAVVPMSAISVESGAAADVLFSPDRDALAFGRFVLRPLRTPGHTRGCCSFYLSPDEVDASGEGGGEGKRKVSASPGMVFSGDCLLVRGCGRTDFQGGSSRELYSSVRSKLFSLPEDTVVYPAHDYRGFSSSTIGEEMKFNPRLGLRKTEEEFVEIMEGLGLPRPKAMDEAVPINLRCGEQ